MANQRVFVLTQIICGNNLSSRSPEIKYGNFQLLLCYNEVLKK